MVLLGMRCLKSSMCGSFGVVPDVKMYEAYG